MQLLSFRAAGASWAVSLDFVQEIVDTFALTPLPLLPPAVPGVLSLRGLPVPAIDVARAGGHDRGCSGPAIVILTDGGPWALRIDAVDGLLDAGALDAPAEDAQPWVAGRVGDLAVIDVIRLRDSLEGR